MILYARLNGIEGHTITRDIVTPKITPKGEQVLELDWVRIGAFINVIFDKRPLKERLRST